jgi:predicted O-methyltransferase YrrM
VRPLFPVLAYLRYWLDAVEEHSLHSPFYYDLYTRVIQSNQSADPGIEKIREHFLNSRSRIRRTDAGSGTPGQGNDQAIADIALKSLTPWRYSRLYQRLIQSFKSKTILELGTSLGVNALYLAAEPGTQVITFEADHGLAAIAQEVFEEQRRTNVRLVEGPLSATLHRELEIIRKIDFALIDADHREQPTLGWFNAIVRRAHDKTVAVVDDIHRDAGMERAWKQIRNHDLVHGTVDLFRCGLVFFDPRLTRQHLVLSW